MDEEMLPKFNYYIYESDPDIVVLRRQDGSFAAAFSARGSTTEGIVEATKEDYRKLIEAHAGSMDFREALRVARDEYCRAKGEPKGGEIQDTIDTSFHKGVGNENLDDQGSPHYPRARRAAGA